MAQAIRSIHFTSEPAGASQAVEQVYADNLPEGGGEQTTIPTGALVPGAGIDLDRDDAGVLTCSVKAKGVTAAMLADGVIPAVPAAPTADTLSGATDTGKAVLKAKDAAAARAAIGAGAPYTLPSASTTAIGGVKKAGAIAALADDADSAAVRAKVNEMLTKMGAAGFLS